MYDKCYFVTLRSTQVCVHLLDMDVTRRFCCSKIRRTCVIYYLRFGGRRGVVRYGVG